MSNKIPNAGLYQFLARPEFNKNGKSWVDVADGDARYGNGDGAVTYNEFMSFLEDNWDSSAYGAINNDIIEKFWCSIDTDTKGDILTEHTERIKDLNALNKNELKALDDKLQNHIILAQVYEEAKDHCPDHLKYTNWNQYVNNGLTVAMQAFMDEGKKVDKLEDHLRNLLPQIEAEATAKCQADYSIDNLKKTLLKGLDSNGYDIANDAELAEKINLYVAGETVKITVNGEEFEVSIKNADGSYKNINAVINDVNKIITSHLQEKGLDTTTGKPTEVEGTKIPTDVQIAALKTQLSNAASKVVNASQDFGNYKENVVRLVPNYIQAKGSEMLTAEGFNAVKQLIDNEQALLADFKAVMKDAIEEAKVAKLAQDELDGILADFENNEKLKSNIKNTLGIDVEDAWNQIMSSAELEAILLNAKNDVSEFAFNGKVDENKLALYIVNKLSAVLGDIFQDGYELDTKNTKNINEVYDDTAVIVEKDKDNEKRLEQYAKLTEGYLKDIASLSEEHAKAIKSVFTKGTDAESIMKEFDSVGDIKNAVNNVKTAIASIVDTTGVQFDAIAQQKCYVGKEHQVATKLNNPNNINITYDLQGIPSGVTASIDKMSGALKFKANEVGFHEITVVAKSGNKVVTTQTVTFEVTEAPGKTFDEVQGGVAFKGYKISNALTASSSKGIDLSGWQTLEEAKTSAISNIETHLAELGQLLIGAGMSKTAVDNAVKATVSLYSAAIACMTDLTPEGGKSGGTITSDKQDLMYDSDGDGTSDKLYEGFRFGFYGNKDRDDVDIINGAGMKSATGNLGLRLEEAHHGNKANEYIIGVNITALLKTFKGILNGTL